MFLFTIPIYNSYMSILCLGQAVFDTFLPLESELIENQKIRIQQSSQSMGGPVANASYLCALWKADTYTIARIGDDVYGHQILDTMKSVGIHTESMLIDSKTHTSFSTILVNTTNGNRTILNVPLSEENPLNVSWPKDIDVLLMDGHEIPLCLEAIKRYPNAITILDGDKYKPNAIHLYQKVDYLVCSSQFAKEYTQQEINENTYHQLCAFNKNHVILTLGEKGCLYKGKNYPAYLTKSIDTTGAGDVFHGAFAYGIHKKWNIDTIIKVASQAASLSTEKLGGMASIPTLEEVQERYGG